MRINYILQPLYESVEVSDRLKKINPNIKVFSVGGSVRDEIMGIDPKDTDYVVVGATPEDMEAAGLNRVGADFPVFLDKDGNEYALARTERKSGKGYKGFDVNFDPSTSIEDDLFRRDFTMNAITKDFISGEIFDPFKGKEDIKKKVIRHVSDAFAEDPLRVLRAARFAARFNFSIAPETMKFMKQLVDDGELDYLTAERVWKEVSRAMMEKHPHKFFEVLSDCSALETVFGAIGEALNNAAPTLRTLAKKGANERQRWMGAVIKAEGVNIENFIKKGRLPTGIVDAVRFVKRAELTNFDSIDSVMNLLNKNKTWNNLTLFEEYARMIGMVGLFKKIKFDLLITAAKKASEIRFEDLKDEEKANLVGPEIGKAIETKRRMVVQKRYLDKK
jgi:tRNA nucleotidyltransferase/poly(A) polymerase